MIRMSKSIEDDIKAIKEWIDEVKKTGVIKVEPQSNEGKVGFLKVDGIGLPFEDDFQDIVLHKEMFKIQNSIPPSVYQDVIDSLKAGEKHSFVALLNGGEVRGELAFSSFEQYPCFDSFSKVEICAEIIHIDITNN